MKQVTISENDCNQRLDKFLTKAYPNLPQSMLYKCIRKKDIKINGKRCAISTRLVVGDVITMYLKDEFFQQSEREYDFLKAPHQINIVYEDENILLVDKKPGLLVHPDDNYHFDSLIARIKHYLHKKQEYLPEDEHTFTPALVNRIDRNTGGIVIAAKNAETLRIMNEKVRNRELNKRYLCIVCGKLKHKEALLTGYLEKNENQNRVYIHKHGGKNKKTIKTRYHVLQESGDFSLLDVELITGRTHQIRAHFAAIGHPLAGDGKYGKNSVNREIGFPYQALYAYRLGFHFTSESGILTYLNGKTVQVDDIWFLESFRNFQ